MIDSAKFIKVVASKSLYAPKPEDSYRFRTPGKTYTAEGELPFVERTERETFLRRFFNKLVGRAYRVRFQNEDGELDNFYSYYWLYGTQNYNSYKILGGVDFLCLDHTGSNVIIGYDVIALDLIEFEEIPEEDYLNIVRMFEVQSATN